MKKPLAPLYIDHAYFQQIVVQRLNHHNTKHITEVVLLDVHQMF